MPVLLFIPRVQGQPVCLHRARLRFNPRSHLSMGLFCSISPRVIHTLRMTTRRPILQLRHQLYGAIPTVAFGISIARMDVHSQWVAAICDFGSSERLRALSHTEGHRPHVALTSES